MARYLGTTHNDSVTGIATEYDTFVDFGIGEHDLGWQAGNTFVLSVDELTDRVSGDAGAAAAPSPRFEDAHHLVVGDDVVVLVLPLAEREADARLRTSFVTGANVLVGDPRLECPGRKAGAFFGQGEAIARPRQRGRDYRRRPSFRTGADHVIETAILRLFRVIRRRARQCGDEEFCLVVQAAGNALKFGIGQFATLCVRLVRISVHRILLLA